jgi:hypothetical protein
MTKKKAGYVFAKKDVAKYYAAKDKLPTFKEIVASEVKKHKPVNAQKIMKDTNLKPITVYKSLERLRDEDKRVKVVKKEKIATTPKQQDEIFVIKYYAPTKGKKKK